jgi:hypothetical protein
MEKLSKYFESFESIKPILGSSLVIKIPPGIADADELMRVLVSGLGYEDYFGENWNALEDVLRNLSWVPSKTVVILHSDLPLRQACNRAELDNYLGVLSNSVRDWIERPGKHSLHVAFPGSVLAEIASALKGA